MTTSSGMSVLSGQVQVLRKTLAYDAHSLSFLVHKYLHRSNVGYEIEQLYMQLKM